MIFTAHSRTRILFPPSFSFSLLQSAFTPRLPCLHTQPATRQFRPQLAPAQRGPWDTIWPCVVAVVGGSSGRGALWEKMATTVHSRVVRALPMSRKCHRAPPLGARFRDGNLTFLPHTLGLCVKLCTREGVGELKQRGGEENLGA